MGGEQQPELLGAGDPVLLGQDVHRVLLAVRGDNVRVVAGLIILTTNNLHHEAVCQCVGHLVVVQGEQGGHLQLPDGVLPALPGHMEDLHSRLQRDFK